MDHARFDALCNAGDWEALAHVVLDDINARRAHNEPINETQLTVLAVETFFGEVCNGGFTQFFGNQGHAVAPHTEAALRRVGLHAYADIMARATNVWPDGVIPTNEAEYESAYNALLDGDLDPWTPHDDAVYTRMASEPPPDPAFRIALAEFIVRQRRSLLGLF